jgi:hypothetical protein
LGRPVPWQPEHLSSVDASSDFIFSGQSFLRYHANALHVVMQHGLLAPIVPLQRYSGPIRLGDGAQVVLVVTPTNAGADVQQSGLGAGHWLAVSSRLYRRGITLAA